MRSKVEILSAKGKDRDKWIHLLQGAKGQEDIHFHPDYMRIYEATYGYEAKCFLFQNDDAVVLYPFIIRDIPDEQSQLQDITSVYGYGGPICVSVADEIREHTITQFSDELQSWFQKQGFVSEFCLVHPLFSRAQMKLLPSALRPQKKKDVLISNLQTSSLILWSRFEERQKKAIVAGRKKGVKIVSEPLTKDNIARFHERYLETMEKVDATDFWKFPDTYFWNCVKHLGERHTQLLSAIVDGKKVASILLLKMFDTVYYHFSCSNIAYRSHNCTTLLLFDAMLLAQSEGYKWFHMGGGRTDGTDSLFKFKASFAGERHPLYMYERILDEQAYERLTDKCFQREIKESGKVKNSNFFPRYRSV